MLQKGSVKATETTADSTLDMSGRSHLPLFCPKVPNWENPPEFSGLHATALDGTPNDELTGKNSACLMVSSVDVSWVLCAQFASDSLQTLLRIKLPNSEETQR